MTTTPRLLFANESARHATPSPNVNKNDFHSANSSPKFPSFIQPNSSAPTFKPKLQLSAPLSKSQASSQLRLSSQPFLRQLTLSSPPFEPFALVPVHDTSSSTSSQLNIPSTTHKLISPPATLNSSRPSSSESSRLLSLLNAPITHTPSTNSHHCSTL